jgi:tetratricopeptide (TPR) repeat protein
VNIFKSSDSSVEAKDDLELHKDLENSNEKSELSSLVSKAERFYNRAEYDSSASAYKLILRKYPMHLSSLNGLYNIAQKYIEKGNNQKREGKYYEALELYRKALQLQPEDKTIESLIESCRNSLIEQSNQTKIEEQKVNQKPDDQKKNAIVVEKQAEEKPTPVNPKYNLPKNSFWNLEELLNEDFSINGNDIRFKENSRSKKVVNTYVLKDIVVSVKAIFKNLSSSNSAGIIIGYNWNKSTSVEKYFLFTVEPGKRFVLNEVTDASKKELISIPYSSETMNDTDTYLLSVKYFGAWIMIYSRDKLLKAFYNDSFIIGKIGLYADANTDVEFTSFNIAPAVDNLKE